MHTQTLRPADLTIQFRIEMLGVDDPCDPLIDDIYDSLLVPYFPEEDRDGREAIRAFLGLNSANLKRKIQYRVVAAFRGAALAGVTIFTIFGCDGFCIMNGQYTSVMPAERGRGLARLLSCYREEASHTLARSLGYEGLDFTIITLANPRHPQANTQVGTGPGYRTLQAIWHRWGHDLVDFPYVQLPLADGGAALSDVLMGIKRYSSRYRERDYLTAGEMRAVIDACNHFRFSKTPKERYPQYNAMLDYLEKHPETKIIV